MAAGGGGGTLWIKLLIGGGVLAVAAFGLEHGHIGPGWLIAGLQAVGGMAVVFGSCEAMILSVEGTAKRAKWNSFVAGTMAGLASNIPEVVMLGFVVSKEPRIGFIVVVFTVHVGAMIFGIYSGLLPRDPSGEAKLPEPLVKLSTDQYACAGGVFLATGSLMMMIRLFGTSGTGGNALGALDLYVIGGILLAIEVVVIRRLVKRFSQSIEAKDIPREEEGEEGPVPSVGKIIFLGALGIATSVVGGHSVGEFAGTLVKTLTASGYSEMLGALILSVFASAGPIVMIAMAHAKGKHDIALANASGSVTQVPFVVLPIALIQIAFFSQMGIVPTLKGGGALAIDLQTTSVLLLAFPPMLILWKAVQDDGKVNWVETSTMVGLFGLTVYFLATHA